MTRLTGPLVDLDRMFLRKVRLGIFFTEDPRYRNSIPSDLLAKLREKTLLGCIGHNDGYYCHKGPALRDPPRRPPRDLISSRPGLGFTLVTTVGFKPTWSHAFSCVYGTRGTRNAKLVDDGKKKPSTRQTSPPDVSVTTCQATVLKNIG